MIFICNSFQDGEIISKQTEKYILTLWKKSEKPDFYTL